MTIELDAFEVQALRDVLNLFLDAPRMPGPTTLKEALSAIVDGKDNLTLGEAADAVHALLRDEGWTNINDLCATRQHAALRLREVLNRADRISIELA